MNSRAISIVLAAMLSCGTAAAAPFAVPFDYSRGAIGLDVTVRGAPLYMILDTGVDPSVIDLSRAVALGLAVDRKGGGEVSGEGDAKQALAFPSSIENLAVAGHDFAPVDALAFDMSTLSAQYGRKVGGILGYSFLKGRIVLIDYGHHTLGILDRAADAVPVAKLCRKHWSIPLQSFEDDIIPKIPHFRLGAASGPVSLDTGSDRGIILYQSALDLPGVRDALSARGEVSYTGARGTAKAKSYVLTVPVGFGPFTLPAGQVVTLRSTKKPGEDRIANAGNKIFAAMKLRILLDYRARQMTFYGDCR
ncbi:MAG: retropepsin-like aspartic protease [Rhizomicrobium sp.]